MFEPYRKRGIGLELWGQILALARRERKAVSQLVFLDNDNALRLSERMVFRALGLTR